MKKLINYFELHKPYRFDVTDIVAIIYTFCAIGIMCGLDMTIPFFIGSFTATAFCWQARRVNLVILNVALFAMNCYNFVNLLATY